MSATETLRKDHQEIKRVEKIVIKCYQALYDGKDIPLSDIEKITFLISEFLDSIHYSREEDSYFPCVAAYDSLKEEVRALLIEHEFSRNIARMLSTNLTAWKMARTNASRSPDFSRHTRSIFRTTCPRRRSFSQRQRSRSSQGKRKKKCISSFSRL